MLEVMDPAVAVMLVGPSADNVVPPVANPVMELMVATVVLLDAQVTALKSIAAVPSVRVPLTVNCLVYPTATLEGVGVIASVASSGSVTVKAAVLVEAAPVAVAVIVVLPTASVVAMPLVLIATAESLDAQVTDPETFPVDESEKVPVAVNVTGTPLAADSVVGAMAMLVSVTADAMTVRLALSALMGLSAAVTVVVPAATPVATPALLIVAEAGVPVPQVTWLVMFSVVLFE